MITISELQDKIEYRDGQLFRLSGKGAGLIEGTSQGRYLTTMVNRKHVYLHHAVWALVHGEWPTEIDHINQDKHDNRIENLRLVTKSAQNFNRPVFGNNTSGVTGVSWNKQKSKWTAKFGTKFLGAFEAMSDAITARVKAELGSADHLRGQP